ncbi:MAG: MBL fold metallo-hydrolase [Candidatus Hecatellales archaeon]|nr:MAG: MBL fold metallo-hydrolase [Candidatus Hecatellales archaeon]
MFRYGRVEFTWLGHDCFKIKGEGLTLYFDPFELADGEPADLILITHEHFDHLSPSDVAKISTEETSIVTIPQAASNLSGVKAKEIVKVSPGSRVTVKGVEIEAVPAYNVNKFRAPGVPFHPKEERKVGFLVNLAGVKIYHAGDTDVIPEMEGLQPDVALLPVSGTYVMTAEEAAEALKLIKPKVAIPMHYGAIVGSKADAQRFQALAPKKVQVVILEKEA